MAKKRTKIEIMHDILEVIKNKNGKIKPTHILYKSNLSYQMMEEYLRELIAKEMVVERRSQGARTYLVTEKGMAFLSEYKIIKEFTSSFGLD